MQSSQAMCRQEKFREDHRGPEVNATCHSLQGKDQADVATVSTGVARLMRGRSTAITRLYLIQYSIILV